MHPIIRRSTRALAAVLLAGGALVLAAPAASADPMVPFDQDVYASTHLAKSGIDITVPRGEFVGSIDLATGNQTGRLTLPPATVTMNFLGLLPAADASFVMAPVGPITGHVDLATFTVDTTASFNVRLASLTPHGTSINLVGDRCSTTKPISVTMHGVVNPATGGTFASTYSIPSFENCEAMTPLITALVSGPGNTFMASFAPHGAPPPAAPASSTPPPAPLVTGNVNVQATVSAPPAPVPVTISQNVPVLVPAPALPPIITATPAPAPSPAPAPTDPVSSLLKSLLGG